MKIFIDFDDVLFNTQAFTAFLQEIFKNFGIGKELFRQTYEEVKKHTGGKNFSYTFEAHVKALQDHLEFDGEGLLQVLKNETADTSKFLFPDTLPFLEFLRKAGHSAWILSFGDSGYQMMKIQSSGVGDRVGGVIITQERKERALEQQGLTQNEEAYFFDDRAHFLEGAKKIFPALLTVLVSRPEGRYADRRSALCDYHITNFQEGIRLLEGVQTKS
jgi:FMN phosphatase YigB (HAD superfamily)